MNAIEFARFWSEMVETGVMIGHGYGISYNPCTRTSYNGYVLFTEPPVKEENELHGILPYVPVHGGITFHCSAPMVVVYDWLCGLIEVRRTEFVHMYGFDTSHCDSEEFPIRDLAWIRKQCLLLIHGLIVAGEIESAYEKATTNEEKAEYAQQVLDVDRDHESRWNMGIGIRLLSGKL